MRIWSGLQRECTTLQPRLFGMVSEMQSIAVPVQASVARIVTRGLRTSSAAGSGSAVCSKCVQQNTGRCEGEKRACPVGHGTDTVPFATMTKMLRLHKSPLDIYLSE